jgi:hypothetical protein
MKIASLILSTLLVGCSSLDTDKTATQQFFNLDTNLQHVNMLYYFDGGTVGLELTDIHGKQANICIDNEGFSTIIATSEKGLPETTEYINRRKQKCIYLGATHHEDNGAEKIEYRSDLEAAVLERINIMMTENPEYHDEFSRFIDTTKTERHLTVIYEDDLSKYE